MNAVKFLSVALVAVWSGLTTASEQIISCEGIRGDTAERIYALPERFRKGGIKIYRPGGKLVRWCVEPHRDDRKLTNTVSGVGSYEYVDVLYDVSNKEATCSYSYKIEEKSGGGLYRERVETLISVKSVETLSANSMTYQWDLDKILADGKEEKNKGSVICKRLDSSGFDYQQYMEKSRLAREAAEKEKSRLAREAAEKEEARVREVKYGTTSKLFKKGKVDGFMDIKFGLSFKEAEASMKAQCEKVTEEDEDKKVALIGTSCFNVLGRKIGEVKVGFRDFRVVSVLVDFNKGLLVMDVFFPGLSALSSSSKFYNRSAIEKIFSSIENKYSLYKKDNINNMQVYVYEEGAITVEYKQETLDFEIEKDFFVLEYLSEDEKIKERLSKYGMGSEGLDGF